MRRDAPPASDAGVDAAIERVLSAERDARAAIERSERDAASRLEAARARARAIDERAERRIRAARERFEANVAREVGAIARQAASLPANAAMSAIDGRRIDEAVARLAAELTGGHA